ncbi:hypothetical protein [Streptomyces sp. NPDC056304]|uniref:hypothetical protein n=1 Tax=Streptomyces sp. NPDC056304 TaxID=3345778 RepID=UPI0035E29FEA
MSDDLHSDRAGSGGAMVGKRSTNPGAGNKPGLSRSLLDDLTHVLTAYGCPERDTEQLVRAVAATHHPEAVTDILQATPPEPAAWTALIDGYLNQVGSRYLLTEEATPAGG